jgi:hypothetical protein
MPPPVRTAGLAVVALLLTAGLTRAGPMEPEQPPVPRASAPATPVADTFRSVRGYPAVALPVRLRIPALHLVSTLHRLGRLADGTIAVPGRPDVAGWYEQGPRPGQPGPAVILGHVDSRTGPGIFLDLVRIAPGAAIHVDRADRTTVTFRVTEVARVSKTRFPTDLVYAPTLEPALRLVTCGGSFDESQRSYRDNVIVFAVPA